MNPNWKKGISGNPHGRPKKKSAEPVARMIERFIRKNITPNRMQKLYDSLDAGGKLTVLTDLLPYCISKKPTQQAIAIGNLSDQQLDDLYSQVIENAGLLSPVTEDADYEETTKQLTDGPAD